LDETGGRYVHLIADGDIGTSGDVARALACGADAVMLGQPLSFAEGAPAGGAWWHSSASHPNLPRGTYIPGGEPMGTLEEILYGPAEEPHGMLNLFGGLKRAMAKCGYRDVKEFQRVELTIDR
ncbi:MAG: IMP dehydrogenase, partial [Longispora sp.]|nr:IMP dehydrogenase [Longispora sp. (in: high G+C Gram-positive bacteria)]